MSILDSLSGGGETLEAVLASASANKLPVITAFVVRELHEDDLRQLAADRDAPGAVPLKSVKEFDIQKVRARHHSVARLLAQGLPEGLVATMTGFEPGTVSTLKNSPAMQELIEHYRSPVDQATAAMGEKLRTLASLAVDEMTDRLTDAPGEVKMDQLIAAAKLGFDRTGMGPTSTTKVEGGIVHYDADRLRKLHQSARLMDAELIEPLNRQAALPGPDDL